MRDLKQWQKKINPPPLSGAGVKHPKKGPPHGKKCPHVEKRAVHIEKKPLTFPIGRKKASARNFLRGAQAQFCHPPPSPQATMTHTCFILFV